MTVVDMIDVIHADLSRVPSNVKVGKIAGYTTGTSDIRWDAQDWRKLSHIRKVRIDQSDSTMPSSGDVKDVENGASTIATAIEWVKRRHELGLGSTIYIQASGLQACEEAARAAGVEPYYWLADWNLDRESAAAQLGGRIVAIQWASPTTNPRTVVPGTRLTLSEINCDMSVASESWLPSPVNHHKHFSIHHLPGVLQIKRKVMASTAGGGIGTALTAVITDSGAHLTSTEGAAIASLLALILGYLVPSEAAKK